MPRLHEFDGWYIYMYFKDHSPPHIHIIRDNQDAVYTLDGRYLHGSKKGLNEKKLKEIILRNRSILLYNWEQMHNGKQQFKKLK